MCWFASVSVDDGAEGVLVFEKTDGSKYTYDISKLAELDEQFSEVAHRYRDPFVLKRSVFQTTIPDTIVSFIKWQDDSCDIPVGGFFFDYEDFFVPFLTRCD